MPVEALLARKMGKQLTVPIDEPRGDEESVRQECVITHAHKCLHTNKSVPLHTTRALTVVSMATKDEQPVVRRREAVLISGRRTRATGNGREVRPSVSRGVQHEEVVQSTCKSSDSQRAIDE